MVFRRIVDFWTKPELIYLDKYAYTTILLLTHLIYSMSSTLFGPTFVDLKYTLNTTMQMISLFPTIFSVGNTFGTLFGLIYKYVNRQITLICLLVLMAISSTTVPFTQHIWQLFVCSFLFGIGAGAWITSYNVWLIEMWQDKAGQVLFLSQLMYGIGSVLGPIIDRPYLTGEISSNKTVNHLLNNNEINENERRDKLVVPYLISGGIQIIFPTLLVVMYFMRRYQNQVKNIQMSDQKKIKLFDRFKKRRIIMITLIAICLSAINSMELLYFNFWSTYLQYIPLSVGASRAAEFSSALGTAYTAGQAVNFFISMIISTKYMIGYHFLITLVSIICLFFVQNSETGLWILSISVGFGFSLIYPGVLSFSGQYIEITNRIGTILWFACGAVQFVPPIILGKFIETETNSFIIIQIIHLIISFMAFISILILITKSKKLKIND